MIMREAAIAHLSSASSSVLLCCGADMECMVNDGSFGCLCCVLPKYCTSSEVSSLIDPGSAKAYLLLHRLGLLQYDKCKLVGRYVSSVCTLYVELHWHSVLHL